MDKVYFIAVIFVSTLFLLSPGTVLSQQEERLAVVSEYEGDVRVEHESILKTVKKIGNRIRNSAVYEDSSVMTMHASTADLVFNDNTSLQIDENTSLTIGTREVSEEEKADDGFIRQVSGKQSEIVRNIYVKAGKFLANITPSKSVLTEFETPTGVAAVRGTMFTLAYVGGVTSIDLTEGLVNFASAGDDVSFSIEPGDSMDISIPELGHTSVGVNTGQIDVATETGTLIIESGESTGVEVDTDTGEVTVTAEEGTVDFETSTGTAVIEEGEAAGTSVDADTGEVTISSEEGSVVFETAMGNVMMDEGDTMGSRMDAETGDMIMTAEEGTIEFETAMGNVMMDEGDSMGSHMDAETGDMIMTAEEGTIEFETAMGNAVLQEGAVLEVAFDDNTGEMSLSSGGGTSTLETDNGTITMDEGGSMNFTVNDNTGEITVIGTTGDITMTNEDGTTMTLEGGTNMGIMQDDGNEGPMEPGPGPDDGNEGPMEPGPGPDDGNEGPMGPGPGPDDSYDEPESDGTIIFEGAGTASTADGQGVFDGGTYTEATGVFEGTYTDTAGNTANTTDFQQSSFNAAADDTTTTAAADADETAPSISSSATASVAENLTSAIAIIATDTNTITYSISGGDSASFSVDSSSGVITFDSAPDYESPGDSDTNNTYTFTVTATDTAGNADTQSVTITVTDTVDGLGVINESEPNNSISNAQSIGGDFKIASNPDIIFSDIDVPWVSIAGTGDGTFDYYSFPIDTEGTLGIFDIDYGKNQGGSMDTTLHLYDDTGVSVEYNGDAYDDDSAITEGAAGSIHSYDSYLEYTFDTTGTYVIAVGEYSGGLGLSLTSHASDTPMQGNVPDAGDTYTLQVSRVNDLHATDIFKDDFSTGDHNLWNIADNAYIDNSFGTIGPKSSFDGNFTVIHTGLESAQNKGLLEKRLLFTKDAIRQITFDYNFVTQKLQDDFFKAEVHFSDGRTIQLAYEDIYSDLAPVSGLPTNVLNSSDSFQTGWKSAHWIGLVPGGPIILQFHLQDVGDLSNDSVVLIDNVVDPIFDSETTDSSSEASVASTDYLLTFARILRGEVDIHDADLEADAVASAEHQAFIAKVNEVISDIENSSNSELVTGEDAFLDRLVVARGIVADHEDTTGFLQQTGVAHHLLEASIMTDRGIGTNIAAIKDSINQAKAFLVAHVNDFGETDALASIKTNIDSVLANIDNVNNNEFTTATIVAIRDGIKQAISDTLDHMNNNGCNNSEHPECGQQVLPCRT